MLELPVLLSAPQLRQGLKRGAREEPELGCHVAVSYPVSPLVFMAHVGFAGFLGLGSLLEPPRHLRGCGLLRLGAVKLRCRRWLRLLGRCWHGGRLFWERRGKCLTVSGAVAGSSISCSCRVRKKSASPGKLLCVAAEQPPASPGRGG